jgi:IS5 family transposase
VLGEAASKLTGAFRSRVRTVRKLAQQLHRIARREGQQGREALVAAYTKLIQAAERTGAQGKRVLEALKRSAEKGAEHLAGRLGEFLPRLTRGIDQARRRGLEGGSVPAKEKRLSLFEPHTQIIPRFKAGQPVEFGRKLGLDEVEGGIISGYAILERGGGQDQPYLKDSLEAHRRHFGRAPGLLAADRGTSSAENEELAQQAGVKLIALPRVGNGGHLESC